MTAISDTLGDEYNTEIYSKEIHVRDNDNSIQPYCWHQAHTKSSFVVEGYRLKGKSEVLKYNKLFINNEVLLKLRLNEVGYEYCIEANLIKLLKP